MKPFKTIFLAFSFLICLFACGHHNELQQVNCRERFEKYYDVNVQGFMRAMPPDMDTQTAKKIGECVLNKLYKIDSTFVLKDGKELEKFLKSHANLVIECDSIIQGQ